MGFGYHNGIQQRSIYKYIHVIAIYWYLFAVSHNNMSGAVDTSPLPDAMKEFVIGANAFSGEFDLGNLPGCLEQLHLQENRMGAALMSLSYCKHSSRLIFINLASWASLLFRSCHRD